MTPDVIRVASAQYPVGYFAHWDDFEAKLSTWVQDAARADAQLLVFPEYASLELVSLCSEAVQRDVRAQLPAMQAFLPALHALHERLARDTGTYILGGSVPVEAASDVFVNRAHLYGPDGTRAWQDKLVMTRFEDDQWGVNPGHGLSVFDTALGRLGVNICYDSEFPHLARAQAEAGMEVLLVPSCTESAWGYHRVRTGSLARALENQVYAVHAPLVGEAPWTEAIDKNSGAAGVYTPSDNGLPADGLLALGRMNEPAWLHATLDLALTRAVRADGHVLNARDYPKAAARTADGAGLWRV
ncbi:carbon-nitrogen hydrolase family protein [Deinococcus maricopensis]|uniref:Nitrilase/cyanide hydratase and apolipoprotein N-acyltransferase n=1 Tax=Deinococcus maricopensis (strain DSM 21211 / LMG 22137 / NRRL B-23946 / LB-34) TaxID=709986 RepID=E8U3W8_DEIML|nr:carbon-nitrogen hydrolase family protein [Deinococcus maricopensis]ADV68811.1 Nitrilase/cyanide hydratase and apolipoprotein N-acyltransferase [Deinococcus maricopensis DSM 21211]